MHLQDGVAVIRGAWAENGSATACDSQVHGSDPWGNVTLRFDAAETSFTGNWDDCGDGSSRTWRGTLGGGQMMPKDR